MQLRSIELDVGPPKSRQQNAQLKEGCEKGVLTVDSLVNSLVKLGCMVRFVSWGKVMAKTVVSHEAEIYLG